MSFIGEITLDVCEIETRGATRDDVVAAARLEPRDVDDWYLTITRGDDDHEEYIDATMEDEATFTLRCAEDGKQFRTACAVTQEVMEALALSFYDHDRGWKTLCAWEEIPPKRGFGLENLFS